jgi:hypothetical protein
MLRGGVIRTWPQKTIFEVGPHSASAARRVDGTSDRFSEEGNREGGDGSDQDHEDQLGAVAKEGQRCRHGWCSTGAQASQTHAPA